ncbi:class I SAM-dependent methyltransferase [Chlamydiota bacterium]
MANIERLHDEKTKYDDNYAKQSTINLVIPTREKNRYLTPSEKPIYGRAFSFFVLGDVKRKTVLDLGCGSGENTVFLYLKGAKVFAIDYSFEGIVMTQQRLEANNITDNYYLSQMNAEELAFKDNSFDIVLGNAILHHLDIKIARDELFRILKKGGKIILREPYVDSRILRCIRKLVPFKNVEATKYEKVLEKTDIKGFGDVFVDVKIWYFEFISRIHVLFKSKVIVALLHEIDAFLLRKFPSLRKFSSCVVLEYTK